MNLLYIVCYCLLLKVSHIQLLNMLQLSPVILSITLCFEPIYVKHLVSEHNRLCTADLHHIYLLTGHIDHKHNVAVSGYRR